MPGVEPGRREKLRRLRRWLAFSERLDRLIEVAEHPPATGVSRRWDRLQSVFDSSPVASEPFRGVRARVAIRLARLARAVHAEAASAVARSPLEGQAEGQA